MIIIFYSAGTILGSYCGPKGIKRGREASEFLRDQLRNADRYAAEGRTRRYYWGSGQGSEALAFDGQPEVDQLVRDGKMPVHIAPFINHCDEGMPGHNVQGVHIRVSFCCCFKAFIIFIKMTHPPGGRSFPETPMACLVYITIKDVQAGEFLHAAYESSARGVATAEDRRDRGGMDYVNRRR